MVHLCSRSMCFSVFAPVCVGGGTNCPSQWPFLYLSEAVWDWGPSSTLCCHSEGRRGAAWVTAGPTTRIFSSLMLLDDPLSVQSPHMQRLARWHTHSCQHTGQIIFSYRIIQCKWISHTRRQHSFLFNDCIFWHSFTQSYRTYSVVSVKHITGINQMEYIQQQNNKMKGWMDWGQPWTTLSAIYLFI